MATEYLHNVQEAGTFLSRLTIMRGMLNATPAARMLELLDAVGGAQSMLAVNCYFELVSALLEGGYRRVTGSLWKDFILGELLDKTNSFSLMAAKGKRDESVAGAMAHDLALLERLYNISDDTIKRWLSDCFNERKRKPHKEKDTISVMADAAWAGGSLRPIAPITPKAAPVLPERIYEETLLGWDYPAPELDESYVADTALEEVYRRLEMGGNWEAFVDDLWDFHHNYGCGMFLHYKYFTLGKHGLKGLELFDAQAPQCHEAARRKLTQNTIRFMRGDGADNALLLGGAGMGKYTQVLSLAHELPELRLVLVQKLTAEAYIDALDILSGQPLRFVMLFSDLQPGEREFDKFKSMIRSIRAQNENVLIYATSTSDSAKDVFFALELKFEALTLEEFIDMVIGHVRAEGINIEYETVKNACIDSKMDGAELSINAAVRLARILINQY